MGFTRRVRAVDAHACGEPGRVIVEGVPDVPGSTMFDKMEHLREHDDGLRKLMLREPRGYPAANCNVLLPPARPEADAGFVIMEQTEYPPMSGTNTICVATVLLETGIVEAKEPVSELTLDTPAGPVGVNADVRAGKVTRVTFRNVPAFPVHLGAEIEVPSLGTLTVDVAWGGMFYVIAEAERFGLRLEPGEGREIVRVGEMIKAAAREQLPVAHPENPEIAGISISQLWGPARDPSARRRNAVVVSTGVLDWDRPETWTGAIDRSPCGTGTCAAMAILHARGELALGEDFVHEGLLGTRFVGSLVEETTVGDRPAVVPTLGGEAWITGFAEYVLDETDPFPEGFTVGDIWP
ncbi:MAG TPA: proline racemase family protein [Actinomycetota bacterium]|nr:proline racemase family protein [Actinomycetota bacterium]